jgi:putative transposase
VATLESVTVYHPGPTGAAQQGMCLDTGYCYYNTWALVTEFGFTAHVRARGEEALALKKKEAGANARR